MSIVYQKYSFPGVQIVREVRRLNGARKNENVPSTSPCFLYFMIDAPQYLNDWNRLLLDKVCGYGLVQPPRPCVPWTLPLENGRGGKKGALYQ